jgi:DtxR family Mn-dependent transcriptional regulator
VHNILGLRSVSYDVVGTMPSATVEDYIKHIYLVSETRTTGDVPMGQVAEALGVVPGTATTMVKALSDAGLVNYAPRIGVELTEPGRKLALHVLRRHRLIEQFLVEVLDFDWSEVHDEAEQMEHVVSDLLLERIDRYLGHPTEDPHGDPIPSAEGELVNGEVESLVECPLEAKVVVARISDQDAGFLNYITESGLNPGVVLRVRARSQSAESVLIELVDSGKSLSLGLGAAAKIQVRS